MSDAKKVEGTYKKIEAVKKEAGEKIGKVTRVAEKELQKIKKQAGQQVDNFDNYVKGNPRKSVLVSAGVGMALGMVLVAMVSRKMKK